MNNTKTYSEHLAKLNALREEILGIKRDPTAEERKIEAEYAVFTLTPFRPPILPAKAAMASCGASIAMDMMLILRLR